MWLIATWRSRRMRCAVDVLSASRYYEVHWKPLRSLPLTASLRPGVAQTIQEITLAHGRVSAARARSALSTLYGWAMREGLCEANPVINTSDLVLGIKPRE